MKQCRVDRGWLLLSWNVVWSTIDGWGHSSRSSCIGSWKRTPVSIRFQCICSINELVGRTVGQLHASSQRRDINFGAVVKDLLPCRRTLEKIRYQIGFWEFCMLNWRTMREGHVCWPLFVDDKHCLQIHQFDQQKKRPAPIDCFGPSELNRWRAKFDVKSLHHVFNAKQRKSKREKTQLFRCQLRRKPRKHT